ncbi:hypothetical protein O6H91_09G072100 [Diphasiastrum complanatum]|uniref:Uncharacterized protein n=1 Tax=Diphasiastrum complanatum TaxID=34168 RepID=A0ACC2CQK1_DIPCM|nr:hypothetical protein O6H91_09G072100 [Diphasiastrum complanatum]
MHFCCYQSHFLRGYNAFLRRLQNTFAIIQKISGRHQIASPSLILGALYPCWFCSKQSCCFCSKTDILGPVSACGSSLLPMASGCSCSLAALAVPLLLTAPAAILFACLLPHSLCGLLALIAFLELFVALVGPDGSLLPCWFGLPPGCPTGFFRPPLPLLQPGHMFVARGSCS